MNNTFPAKNQAMDDKRKDEAIAMMKRVAEMCSLDYTGELYPTLEFKELVCARFTDAGGERYIEVTYVPGEEWFRGYSASDRSVKTDYDKNEEIAALRDRLNELEAEGS